MDYYIYICLLVLLIRLDCLVVVIGEEVCLNDENCNDLPQLTIESVKSAVIETQYAVRGPILVRALKIEEEIKNNKNHGYPFDKVVKCNIGNPQALGQKPITFTRQVLSVVMNPSLREINGIFPDDVIARANAYLKEVRSVGAYSESQGVDMVREEVARFITKRDSIPAKKEHIFLAAGASEGVSSLLTVLLRSVDDAVLVPLPQYPLYSALISLFGGYFQGYLMAEESGWDLDINELEKSLAEARSKGKRVRALVVINPGNPTGSVLSESTMIELVKFCKRENIILMADEVYQTNIYRDDRPFKSFRSILGKLNILSKDGNLNEPFQLVSFHSTSKGVVGECGLRGGYTEYIGVEQAVLDQIYKLASIKLCSNVPGQLAVGLMVNPPTKGMPSYDLYQQEVDAVYESLKRRAKTLQDALNSLEGIHCNPIEGAMYAFPIISLPKKFTDECLANNSPPDVSFALKLLEATGLVVVPGSGFGQRKDTTHIRTTFLPPEDAMLAVLERFRVFWSSFLKQYS